MALFSVLVLVNCRKEKIVQADCRRLQNATSTADKDEAESVINKFINSLASQTYSPQNLNNLVSAIGQQCGASATLLCFDCIQTLPSQSEIRISYPGISGPVEKTIDITYTASNKMIFHNLHD
ncbi:MAG: hypothetical protein WDO16_25140 [Bacteroidota bacterium]